ncbi:cytochrome c oxidase subunit 4 [Streptomyces sp. NPDC057638]|uniref:aa3-type cytochrome oxidase subunit IV n=1 Tax=Streptomyces sp. NPDC057638 TaxID=3346190 RepID=UPI0036A9788A
MRTEAWLFTGVAVFFLGIAAGYGALARDPAGLAALTVAFLMSGLVAAFLWRQYTRTGIRPEDRPGTPVRTTAGRRFPLPPPYSYAPLTTAAGAALLGWGVVEGVWLCCAGVIVLAFGVFGFVFGGRDGEGEGDGEDGREGEAGTGRGDRAPGDA